MTASQQIDGRIDSTSPIGTVGGGGSQMSTFPNISMLGFLFESASDSLVALAGGAQYLATPLAAELCRIITAAGTVPPYDSVALPPSAKGMTLFVVNHGTNPIQVFGAGTDIVDDVTMPLLGVAITGTAGQFSCTATNSPLLVGQNVVISGVYGGTGSITGYANPTTYAISVTNGNNTFTLTTLTGVALVTTAGTPTGLTYTINGGVTQMANSTVLYFSSTAGNWYTEGLASGFVRGLSLQTFSAANVTGNATITQAAGTPIVSMLANVSGGAASAVTMPASAVGVEITVHNTSAFAVSVFPNAGGTGTEKINALTANSSISLPSQTSTVFTCTTAGTWLTVPRVPS